MNCEIANEKKSQEAARKQVKQGELVLRYFGERLKKSVKEAIILRMNHKEDSLQELSNYSKDELVKSISKSALNHRFRDLSRLSQEIIEKRKGQPLEK